MYESIDSIKSRIKNKRTSSNKPKEKDKSKKTKYFKNLFSRLLIAIIFVLVSIIFTKYNSENLLMYKKYILTDSWSFAKINTFYQKHFGNILPFDNLVKENTKTVFNEQLKYSSDKLFHDGLELMVGKNYMIPSINSGIVVFIGEKEKYGNTVIVQGVDGVDTWYGNITNVSLKLYDYVEKGGLIGESINEKMYLVLIKDGKYLDYNEYTKEN